MKHVAISTPIVERAEFDKIRYAQAWEDAALLLPAIGEIAGQPVLSVGASGDNALALLIKDPSELVVADVSAAQLNCLRLRIAAMRKLSHRSFLALLGAEKSGRGVRRALLQRVLQNEDQDLRDFWLALEADVMRYGVAGVGKLEGYFRILQNVILPLTHSKSTLTDLVSAQHPNARAEFFDSEFDNWRWRALTRVFFSNQVMGKLGRDQAFFEHVDGEMSAHVTRMLRQAAVEQDPSKNPFLHWILFGHHGETLPLAWQAAQYETIRKRLDRVRIFNGALEDAPISGAAGCYLSDIFEYMSEPEAARAFQRFAGLCRPQARLVYWNMMVPRDGAALCPALLQPCPDVTAELARQDRAFFYSGFHADRVIG